MKSKVFYEKYFSLFSRTIVIGDLSRMVIIKFYLWSLWSSFHFQSVFFLFSTHFYYFFFYAKLVAELSGAELWTRVRLMLKWVEDHEWWKYLSDGESGRRCAKLATKSFFTIDLIVRHSAICWAHRCFAMFMHMCILCVYFYADRILEMVMKK